jgi:integrase
VRAAEVKAWYDGLPYGRTSEKLLMVVRAIFNQARSRGWLETDPTAAIERQQLRYSGDYDFYSREEIEALVRAAASEQDAAVYLTAAMTGLRRGELVALRWRDVDFAGQAIRVRANYSFGELVTPKSGKVRTMPMVRAVAKALARLGQREWFTGAEDPVFPGPGQAQELGAGSVARAVFAPQRCTQLRERGEVLGAARGGLAADDVLQ